MQGERLHVFSHEGSNRHSESTPGTGLDEATKKEIIDLFDSRVTFQTSKLKTSQYQRKRKLSNFLTTLKKKRFGEWTIHLSDVAKII